MRNCFKLALAVGVAFGVVPLAWRQLTPAEQAQLRGSMTEARVTIQRALNVPDSPVPAALAGEGEVLIETGLWSFIASFSVDGRVTNTTGTRCLVERDVTEVLSRSAQAIFAGGWNCRLTQHVEGRRLTGGGQCAVGLATMQLDVEVDMDTPRHLSAVLAETILDKGRVHTYAQEEGSWVGPCL